MMWSQMDVVSHQCHAACAIRFSSSQLCPERLFSWSLYEPGVHRLNIPRAILAHKNSFIMFHLPGLPHMSKQATNSEPEDINIFSDLWRCNCPKFCQQKQTATVLISTSKNKIPWQREPKTRWWWCARSRLKHWWLKQIPILCRNKINV